MTKRERYLRNQEKIKTRAIYAILREQRDIFADMLEKNDKSFRLLTTKAIDDDLIEPFLEATKDMVPRYLLRVLPSIMTEGAKEPIKRYKDLLPQGYELIFNVSTEPATKYLEDLEDLMLSTRQGSILKTTRDELRSIMAKWVENGDSYATIAKKIREEDPFVFSKTRAETIAVNEVGRAYWWANHEPWQVLSDDGYVLVKEWATSNDDKVRPTHMDNEEAWPIPFDDPFPWTDDQFAPSHDINCRCTSTHEITGIKSANGIHKIEKWMTGRDIKKIFDLLQKQV